MSPLNRSSRRTFLKAAGAAALAFPFITSNLLAEPPSRRVRHASFGAGGMAWADLTQIANTPNVDIVAVCDVDVSHWGEAKKQFPNARFYQDWRELLDKEASNLDSVNVSTPDHMHAPIAMSAMQLGKHVYCQKPLAHEVYEVRRMTELAHHKKLVTQMGIQVHSDAYYRIAVRLLQDNTVGKIKAVHSWCNKSWGDDTARPDRSDPVPGGFDWNLWLGVCAERPFIGDQYYHPGTWRKRLDFGTGTLGDMGCHIFDPVFGGLELTAPVAVRSEGPAPNAWNWALNGQAAYTFKGTAHTAGETLPVTWYDGTAKPPAEVIALVEGDYPEAAGSIFVGTEGVLLLPHVDRPALYPREKFKDFKLPHLPGLKHWAQFINACRGEDQTTASFAFAGPLAETILLGCVASFFPQTTLQWHSRKLKFDLAEANHHLRRGYRQGWEVKGL
jgi:predicted dehydrogenase